MERLKNMSLRKSFFLLTLCGLLAAVVLAAALWGVCLAVSSQYPRGGVVISGSEMIESLPGPTPEQLRLLKALDVIALLGWVLFPVAGLTAAGALFYRWKLEEPIHILLEGTRRIQSHDLDFTLPQPSGDELGQVCGAFEVMRAELLKTNRELWRQADERKRLNAAFAHDLRNPITVLKGSVKFLDQDPADKRALERLGTYTARLEQYVEAMSSVQRLEQLPVQAANVALELLCSELEETARLFAPNLEVMVSASRTGTAWIDHGIFLTAAENLIGNAARYAERKIEVELTVDGPALSLRVADDGPGFPAALLKDGPKPFDKTDGGGAHLGMGLYSVSLLCAKHGGALCLKNRREGGAAVTAKFYMEDKS